MKQVHPAHQIKVIYFKTHDKLYRKAKIFFSDIRSRNPCLNQTTKKSISAKKIENQEIKQNSETPL